MEQFSFFRDALFFLEFLLSSPPTNIYRQTHTHMCIHVFVCSSESGSRRCYMGGFSQFGMNANLCCYVCVCLLILLLNCFCTEQVLKNTTRQTDGVGYCCCLLCMRMKSAAFDIDYRNTLCAWINVHTNIFKYTYKRTCMYVCGVSALWLLFIFVQLLAVVFFTYLL